MRTKSSILLTIDAQKWYFCKQGYVRECISSSWDSVLEEIAEYTGDGKVLIGLPSKDCFPFQNSQLGKIRSSQVAYDAEPMLPMRAEEMVVWAALGHDSAISVIVNKSILDGIHVAASWSAVQLAGFFPSVMSLASEPKQKGITSVSIETSSGRDVLEFTDGVLASWRHSKPSDCSDIADSRVTIHNKSNRHLAKTALVDDVLKNLDPKAVKCFWRIRDDRVSGVAAWIQSARVLSAVLLIAMALVLLTIGLQRRTSHWKSVASGARVAQVDIYRELMPEQTGLPFSIADRLRSESQVALMNRGVSEDQISAASSLFQLLSSMPEAKGWEINSIQSTGRQVTLTGFANDAQKVPVLSKTLSQAIDSEYAVSVIPKVVRHEESGVEFTLTVGYEAQ